MNRPKRECGAPLEKSRKSGQWLKKCLKCWQKSKAADNPSGFAAAASDFNLQANADATADASRVVAAARAACPGDVIVGGVGGYVATDFNTVTIGATPGNEDELETAAELTTERTRPKACVCVYYW